MMTLHGETRDRILDAVMQLIRGGGVHAVTLSAVCRVAAISKGGLVHHFPTKDALIDAFLERAVSQYLHYLDSHLRDIPLGSGRWAIGFLELFLLQEFAGEDAGRAKDTAEVDDDQCAAVMLALIQSAGRVGVAKSLFDQVLRTLCADGLSPDLATTVLVSMDGFWFQSVIEDPDEVCRRAERLYRQLRSQILAESVASTNELGEQEV